MKLTFHLQGAEPYIIDEFGHTLEEAIEEESHNVASEANSDHLWSPDDDVREEFRQRVVAEATRALRQPGDSYTDPIGIRWSLEEGER